MDDVDKNGTFWMPDTDDHTASGHLVVQAGELVLHLDRSLTPAPPEADDDTEVEVGVPRWSRRRWCTGNCVHEDR